MKEINIKITSKSLSKSYAIKLDDDFAVAFEKDWAILTKGDDSLDAKDLLYAYIQKSYENFCQGIELEKAIKDKRRN